MLIETIFIVLMLIVFAGMLALDLNSYLKVYKETEKHKPWYPKALVILPVKGIDLDMEKNLEAVKKQRYHGDFDVVAVADNKEEQALKLVRAAGIKYIISKYKCSRCSGKVRAIATALEHFRDYDVYVILDSDVTVGTLWLEKLVSPLQDPTVGLSTAFPIFKPKRDNFWSNMKMVWGLVGLGLMESKLTRFGWGGSIAFKRELISKKFMKFFTESNYSVSDDICLTKTVNAKGMKIEYNRSAAPIVFCDESVGTFFEWANRQTALTLLGNKRNMYFGIMFYSAEILLMLTALPLALLVSPIFLLFWGHEASSIYKTYSRTGSKNGMLIVIVLIMPFVYMANLLHASRMDKIEWRGNTYLLKNQPA